MTVAELIDRLRKLPSDAEVFYPTVSGQDDEPIEMITEMDGKVTLI